MNGIYASLLAQMVAQAMGAVAVVPYVSLYHAAAWPLSVLQSLTSIGTCPLQPGLSLFFGLCGDSLIMIDVHPL